jgi:hypothetical protein
VGHIFLGEEKAVVVDENAEKDAKGIVDDALRLLGLLLNGSSLDVL